MYFCSQIANRRWCDLHVSDENLCCILIESYNIDSPNELTVLEKQQRNTILKTCAQRERASAKSHVSQVLALALFKKLKRQCTMTKTDHLEPSPPILDYNLDLAKEREL